MKESKGLLALACGTFALGVAEFAMMGILTAIATSMSVGIPQAGDFISAYALGVSIGAVIPVFFRQHSCKTILLGLSLCIIIGNLCAACSPGYVTFLCSRFLSGLPHGGFFGVGAIVAIKIVPPGRRATAVAIMAMGMTLANMIGVPVVTWLTFTLSWRLTFLMATLWGILAFIGIYFFIPHIHTDSGQSLVREFTFLKGAAPWLIYAATFFGQGSIYCWYSYMEPTMLEITHISPHYIKWVMTLAGTGMFLGGLLSGKLADKYSTSLVSACIATLIIPILLGIYFFCAIPVPALILMFLAAAALFGLGGPMQYLIVRFSKGGEILGGAGIQIAFNVSNACAAFIGGAVISHGWGFTGTALAGLPFAIACAAIIWWFYFRYRTLGA